MEEKLTPGFFCGSAIAALVGLVFGLALHIPWERHPGGPRILFSTAQAAEAHPAPDDGVDATPAADQTEAANLDADYLPPDPLPVVRLHPELFDVQPATDGVERDDADDLIAAESPPALPRDVD